MVQVNVTNYGVALEAATGRASPGLYVDNATLPLAKKQGLRTMYAWGLYGWCGYTQPNYTGGECSNSTIGYQFEPAAVLVSDVPDLYLPQLIASIPDNAAFKNSSYLAGLTRPATWLLFFGTICAGLALITGPVKHHLTFMASSFFSIIGTMFLLIGASIWTSVISKAQDINKAVIILGTGDVPLGIVVSSGSTLWLFWAGFVLLAISTVPYTVSTWAYLKLAKR